jgi:hypothetical protein
MIGVKSLLSVAIGLTVAVIIPAQAYGAAVGSVTPGLTVSPVIEQLNQRQNQKNIDFNVLLTDNTKNPMVIDTSTSDFTAYSETSGIVFLPNLTNRPHGLAQWLKPATNQINLAPGASQTVPVTIATNSSLAPGGHYGALIYKVITAGSARSKGNLIGSNEAVSTLVFLTTYSGSTQSVSLDALPVSRVIFNIPKVINLVMTNTGNTQVAPSGLVTIVNSKNKEVARGIINQITGLTLPGTSRLYPVNLKDEANTTLPGTYRLIVDYRTGISSKTTAYTTSFLLVSERTVVAIGLLILLLVIFIFRRVKRVTNYTFNKKP